MTGERKNSIAQQNVLSITEMQWGYSALFLALSARSITNEGRYKI